MKAAVIVGLLATLVGGTPFTAMAQNATARVGVLSGASLSTPANARFREAFVATLRDLGWEEGRNLTVEARAAEGRSERFAGFAAELLALKVDVVVGSNSQAV